MMHPEGLVGEVVAGYELEEWLGTGPRSWAFRSKDQVLKVRRPRGPGVFEAMLELRRNTLAWSEVGLIDGGPLAGCVYTVEALGKRVSPEQSREAALALLPVLESVRHGCLTPNSVFVVDGTFLLSDAGMSELDDRLRVIGPRAEAGPDVDALLVALGLPLPVPGQTSQQALAHLTGAPAPGIRIGSALLTRSEILEIAAEGPLAFAGSTLLIGPSGYDLETGVEVGRLCEDPWRNIAVSADHSRVAGAQDGELVVYSLRTGERLSAMPDDSETAFALSDDGWQLTTLDYRGQLVVRDLRDDIVLRSEELDHDTTRPILQGPYAASCSPYELRLWDLRSEPATPRYASTIWEEGDSGQLFRIVMSGQIGYFALGYEEGPIVLNDVPSAQAYAALGPGDATWGTPTGARLGKGRAIGSHTKVVLDFAFSPDETLLASIGGDNVLRLWSLPEGRLLGELLRVDGYRLAFSPDGAYLALGAQGKTSVYPLACLRELLRPPLGPMRVVRESLGVGPGVERIERFGMQWVACRADRVQLGRRSLPASRALAVHGECLALARGNDIEVLGGPLLRGHTGAVTALAYDSQGRLASAGEDLSVRVWDAQGQCLQEFPCKEVAFLLAWAAPDEVVAAMPGSTVRLTLGRPSSTYNNDCYAMCAAPSGLVVWQEWSRLHLWDRDFSTSWTDLYMRGSHQDPPARGQRLAFSPDGILLAGCNHQRLVVWQWETGREVAQVEGIVAHFLTWTGERELAVCCADDVHRFALVPA